jgi:RNA polymerase sigma-70 factor (ECF subfamily)
VTYWADIIEQHGPDVWRTAYRLLNHAEDANDCYQETFLDAVEYRRSHAVTCWPAVLRRIATARAMDLLRHRYRTSWATTPLSMLGEEPTGDEASPDVRVQLRESMEQLRQALTEIPARQAEIFWLSEVEMLSHRDIAEQLDITSEQVGLGLHRAKQKLRKLLTERGVTNEVLR